MRILSSGGAAAPRASPELPLLPVDNEKIAAKTHSPIYFPFTHYRGSGFHRTPRDKFDNQTKIDNNRFINVAGISANPRPFTNVVPFNYYSTNKTLLTNNHR